MVFGRVGLGVGKLRNFELVGVGEDSTNTSYIVSSSLMCPVRSGVMAKLMGNFSADSKYSWSPSLPPKLAAGMMSISGSTGGLGDAF